MKLIKSFFNNKITINIITVFGVFSSFFILDLFLRYSSNYLGYYCRWWSIAPNVFTFSWILLFIGILYLLPNKVRMITYSVFLIITNVLTYAQHLYFKVLGRFFSFSDLFLVGEGNDYFMYAIGKTNLSIIIVLLMSILLMIITLIFMKKSYYNKTWKYYLFILIITLMLTISFRFYAYYELGNKVDEDDWAASLTKKNIYLDYNHPNKNIEVSGFYEFLFRDPYLFIKENYFSNKQEIIDDINLILDNKDSSIYSNEYTGIFKDKNVIFILLESIDSWLVTEEVMPTLYKLSNEGINFKNRYSPAFGGGQTVNSEFASITGLYAINNGRAIYNYDKNNFAYSLPNMLKKNGYSAVSIHANHGSFYNRNTFHKALGFEKHYSLYDIKDIEHNIYNYYNDSNLVKNKKVYNLITQEQPFFTYITTFSAHLPYDNTNELCAYNPYNLDIKNNEELSCIRNLAKETDEMIRIMIENLQKDNLLNDTILVLATDHYTYGYDDVNYIKKQKNVDNNYLLQHVPLIIWNNNIKAKEINTIMDTADIVPTLLNMLNINYNPNYYSGTDVFSNNHEQFVYFDKNIFFDGNIFYDGNFIYLEQEEYIKTTLKIIREKIELNNNFIISNYFNNKSTN